MAARGEHKVGLVDFLMARGGPFYELQVRLNLTHRDTLAAAPAGGDIAATCEAARKDGDIAALERERAPRRDHDPGAELAVGATRLPLKDLLSWGNRGLDNWCCGSNAQMQKGVNMAEVGGRRLRLGAGRLSPLLVLSIVWACATEPTVPYTLDTSPLAFLPVDGAGVDDQRGRFREILCAVDEAHGHELPEHRPCSDILHRFTDEPAGTSEPVHVGPAQLKLRVAVVAGLGAECFAGLVSAFPFALERLRGLGYQTASIRVDGLSSSTNNARQVKDAVVAMDLAPAERLVLVGYSKGAPDILEGLVAYPEMGERVAAVVSIAGSVNGSPLADDASPSLLTLLEYLPGSQCDEGDGGAIDSLKPSIRRDFAKAHELPRTVQYYSLSTFAQREQISFGLRGSYDELAEIDPRNDSQMLFYDQIIAGSALLGFVNADHWAVALPISRARPALATTVINRNEFPREMLLEAIIRHVEERLLAVPPRSFESASKPRDQA